MPGCFTERLGVEDHVGVEASYHIAASATGSNIVCLADIPDRVGPFGKDEHRLQLATELHRRKKKGSF